MKKSKGIILASTIVVVLLGIFLGVKFVNRNNDNAKINKNAKNQVANKIKADKKDNFLEESLKEDKQEQDKENNKKAEENNKETINDKENNKKEQDKNKETEKEEKDKTDVKTTNADSISIYDDQYVVKKGDNLFTIAKQFSTFDDVNEVIQVIKDINKIDENSLIKAGDKLYIPTEENFKPSKEEVAQKGNAYVVKAGDTLTSIASKEMHWCDSKKAVKLIMENNNMKKAEELKADQKIYIPVKK